MAATNFTPIQLYFSTTASAVPLAANLAQGELAINITDGKLYYEDNAGAVQVIATKGAGTIGGSTTQIQYNNAGALAGNAAMTFNSGTSTTTLTTLNLTNALGAIYGGTAQSAYAQGDILYSSATNTLSKLGIGTVNYILTSSGSVPQWAAPSSITVNTATNLAGGAAGSVPYQSGVATTTFLAIGAANRVMTSSGTAPQWVTSLTGLTGVSSSSITNTSLTSGRVVVSTTAGLQADDADLTFDGTTLSAGGLSTVGLSTLVKTVKIGDSSFNGVAVFAAATPAKLYMGTGTVTDVTSAISATNAIGAIASLGITPIAATNTSVTYTNAATLYIAGAPSAGTNVTLTNPYSLYVAGGAAYFGGAVTVAGSLSLAAVTVTSLTDSGLTSGRVTFASTGGLLADSANLTWNGTTFTASNLATPGVVQFSTNAAQAAGSIAKNATYGLTYYGITGSSYDATLLNNVGNVALGVTAGTTNVVLPSDASISGLTVGRGAGAVSTNTAVGVNALAANTTGSFSTAIGHGALAAQTGTAGVQNIAVGNDAAGKLTTGTQNTAVGISTLGWGAAVATTGTFNATFGQASLYLLTSGSYNTALGAQALYSNTTASNNTAVGYQAAYAVNGAGGITAVGTSAIGTGNSAYNTTAIGYVALNNNGSTGYSNTAVGAYAMTLNISGRDNVAIGSDIAGTAVEAALYSNTSGSNNVAVGNAALGKNTTASNNTAVGYQAGYTNLTGTLNTYVGGNAGRLSTGSYNTFLGQGAGQSTTTGASFVLIGQGAGSNATTGTYNVYIGEAAGVGATSATDNTGSYNVGVGGVNSYANTSGSNNVAMGHEASRLNTSGANNVAIGYQALRSNTTASDNTAVGYQAGYSNITGSLSSFVGYQAGYASNVNRNTYIGYQAGYNATGIGNTFVGSSAGLGATSGCTGTHNIAIGPWYDGSQEGPLASFTSGTSNIAMGYGSLKNLTTASNNIAIGFNTGQAITTGANNVIIGVGATVPAVNTANSIVMGVNTAGKGTDTGFISPNGGGVYQGNNGATWSVTSDQRLKKNIVNNNIGLEKITAIQVRNFEYRLPEDVDAELQPTDAVKKSGVQLGVIAQELQQVLPECVKTESTGVMSVDTDNLIWYAVNSIKELKSQLDSVKAELATLKGA
jgi:hypothetical protein